MPPSSGGARTPDTASLRETNMRSKRWRGAILGLILTSLLLGALASPSMAQGLRVSRGRHGYASGYRRGYPGGGWGYYPSPYYAPRAGYYFGGSYYGGGRYGRPWSYSYSKWVSPRLRGLLRLQLLRLGLRLLQLRRILPLSFPDGEPDRACVRSVCGTVAALSVRRLTHPRRAGSRSAAPFPWKRQSEVLSCCFGFFNFDVSDKSPE